LLRRSISVSNIYAGCLETIPGSEKLQLMTIFLSIVPLRC
jgi:hypothetical protein